MTYLRSTFFISLILLIFSACGNDDGPEPIRELNVQTLDDDQALVNYLQSHFYNYEDFENDPDNYKIEITIDSLADDNADKIPLMDQVKTKTLVIEDRNENKIPTKLYFLEVKRGIGQSPSRVDSTFVTYKGSLLDGKVFDRREFPMWFNLATGVIRGFREFLPELKAGDHTSNNDGTYEFDNYGKGLVFMPSSLGYYAQNISTIPKYSPLIFSVTLHKVNLADHDNDGILSIDEDPDGDGDPINDDTDDDNVANYLDPDDDGDGVRTKVEYDRNGDGIPDDDDNDGTPDYLDEDNT